MTKPLKTTKQFDPIEFLGITGLNDFGKSKLRKKLETNMAEYILLRILDTLPDSIDKKFKETEILNVEDLEKLLKSHIPNLKSVVNGYLLEFKRHYKHE